MTYSNMMNDDLPIPQLDDDLPETIHRGISMISCHQLVELINNPSSYDQILILDARFQYEFKGGHIMGAKNIINSKQIVDIFDNCSHQKTCVVCYCEFSQNRAQTLYRLIRSYDRCQHVNDYPKLTIPNLYVLESGYNSFYRNYPSHCVGGYIEMYDQQFVLNGTLKRSNLLFKNNMTERSLIRYNQYDLSQPHFFFNDDDS